MPKKAGENLYRPSFKKTTVSSIEHMQIDDLAAKEFYHIKKANDIKNYIADIERSREVDLKILTVWHNTLRMKYSWYYSWHMEKYASLVHFMALGLFILIVVIFIARRMY